MFGWGQHLGRTLSVVMPFRAQFLSQQQSSCPATGSFSWGWGQPLVRDCVCLSTCICVLCLQYLCTHGYPKIELGIIVMGIKTHELLLLYERDGVCVHVYRHTHTHTHTHTQGLPYRSILAREFYFVSDLKPRQI